MRQALALIALVLLAGCAGAPQRQYAQTPCASNPGGYDCQVERYQRAPF
jgi:uncharacterized lipoprotein YmbA